MSWPKAKNLSISVLAVVNTAITAALGLTWVHWTVGQGAAVYGIANALSYLALALYAHTMPATKREPVNVGASISATVLAVIVWGNAFTIWNLDKSQTDLLLALTVAAIGFVATIVRQFTRPTASSLEATSRDVTPR